MKLMSPFNSNIAVNQIGHVQFNKEVQNQLAAVKQYQEPDSARVQTNILVSNLQVIRIFKPVKSVVSKIIDPVYNLPLMIDFNDRCWWIIGNQPANIYHCHEIYTVPLEWHAKCKTGGNLIYDVVAAVYQFFILTFSFFLCADFQKKTLGSILTTARLSKSTILPDSKKQ